MESKTWKITPDTIEKEIEVHSHFGWEVFSSTPTALTMKRENTEVNRKLRKLEKQHNFLRRNFPTAGFIWFIIGLVSLLVGLVLYNQIPVDFLFLIVAGVSLVMAFLLLFMFLITLTARKKLIKELFDNADELRGVKRTLPIPGNIKKPIDRSFKIKQAVYDGELEIK